MPFQLPLSGISSFFGSAGLAARSSSSNGTASFTSVGEFRSTVLCPVFPMVVARTDRPGRLGSRDKSAALLPGSGLDRFEICGFRVSRSPGDRKTSYPMMVFNGRGKLPSLEFHEAAPKIFCIGCNHTLMNKSDDFLFD